MSISRILLNLSIVAMFLIIPFRLVDSQTKIDQSLIAKAERISNDRFPFSTDTPSGVRVLSAERIDFKMLTAIDDGFSELFKRARREGYSKRLAYSDYVVFIAKADRTKNSENNYSPDIAVPAGQYGGSVYDQGGFIYAAGMVIGYTPGAFIIANHDRELSRVSDIVRFEGEHIVLYHNDRDLYHETADHSSGGGHPILH